ncbi:hypothetical protein RCL1_007758 [Eukaryota sp. TZLM3-RCL]
MLSKLWSLFTSKHYTLQLVYLPPSPLRLVFIHFLQDNNDSSNSQTYYSNKLLLLYKKLSIIASVSSFFRSIVISISPHNSLLVPYNSLFFLFSWFKVDHSLVKTKNESIIESLDLRLRDSLLLKHLKSINYDELMTLFMSSFLRQTCFTIKFLLISDCKLIEIDLTNFPSLLSLKIINSTLQNLNISNCFNLSMFSIIDCQDLLKIENMEILSQIKYLTWIRSKMIELPRFSQLISFDYSDIMEFITDDIIYFAFKHRKIQVPFLKKLCIHEVSNEFINQNFDRQSFIEYLHIFNSSLSYFDLTNFPYLKTLIFHNNKYLVGIDARDCHLSTIKITSCPRFYFIFNFVFSDLTTFYLNSNLFPRINKKENCLDTFSFKLKELSINWSFLKTITLDFQFVRKLSVNLDSNENFDLIILSKFPFINDLVLEFSDSLTVISHFSCISLKNLTLINNSKAQVTDHVFSLNFIRFFPNISKLFIQNIYYDSFLNISSLNNLFEIQIVSNFQKEWEKVVSVRHLFFPKLKFFSVHALDDVMNPIFSVFK